MKDGQNTTVQGGGMAAQASQVVGAFVAAINADDMTATEGILDPSFVDHTADSAQKSGREAFVSEKIRALRSAFPDMRLSVEEEVVEGVRIAWRWTLRGTNSGAFAGRLATGRPVEFQGLNIEHISGGKILEHWSVHDSKSLFEQLGLLELS